MFDVPWNNSQTNKHSGRLEETKKFQDLDWFSKRLSEKGLYIH